MQDGGQPLYWKESFLLYLGNRLSDFCKILSDDAKSDHELTTKFVAFDH